jgi:hypothetical protein
MASPLQADKELAAALGRATGAWALLESMLALLFAEITKLDFATAVAIFDFFKSTPTQRDVLLRVAKLSPRVDEPHRAMLVELMSDYQALAKRRNEIAHNPYGWADQEQGQAYIMLKDKALHAPGVFPYTTRNVTKEEIDKLTDDIDLFRFKLLAVRTGIAGLMPSSPKKLP